jgi:glycosyltransferase involved in cell wall biosynthesis
MEKKLNILFLSLESPFPVYKDGVTIRIYNLVKEFSKLANIHLIFLSEEELSQENKNELKNYCRFTRVTHDQSSVSKFKKLVNPNRYQSRLFKTNLRDVLKNFSPNIVFCEQLFVSQYGFLVKQTPVILSVVDAISLAAFRIAQSDLSLLQKLQWYYLGSQRAWIERKILRKAALATTVSWDDARYLTRISGREVLSIPNGTDLKFFSPQYELYPASDRCAIGFSGNFADFPNHETCLYLIHHIFPQLHVLNNRMRFVLAGRGLSTEVIRELPYYVEYRENYQDIRYALKDVLLFLCPVISGTGIKNSVLQAMALEIPVVVTELVGAPIEITNELNGFIACRGPLLVERIMEILGDSEKLRSIGKAGRDHITKNFSWDRIAREYFDHFLRLSLPYK